MNSDRKGKDGERELAAWIREHWGVEAQRGQQHEGASDSPDVRTSISWVQRTLNPHFRDHNPTVYP